MKQWKSGLNGGRDSHISPPAFSPVMVQNVKQCVRVCAHAYP